jgi:hypothetical protein
MKTVEVLKRINELQHLIGTKIPGTSATIEEIIPAPNNNKFDLFFADYLYSQDIDKTIQLHQVSECEILLLLSVSSKWKYYNAWYKDNDNQQSGYAMREFSEVFS